MKTYEVVGRDEAVMGKLLEVWRRSVTATHSFLSAGEIERIVGYIPAALRHIPHLIVAGQSALEPAAFMGIEGRRLEMLFVAPQHIGKGIGKELVRMAVRDYRVGELCVNEDNRRAMEFYEHMGFGVCGRTAIDEHGDPYLLLYMKLRR